MTLSPALAKMISDAKKKYTRTTANVVKPKEGKTKFRLLAATPTEKFWRDLGVHWIKTEPNGKPVAVVGCRDIIYDEACPLCDAIEAAIQSAVDDETRKFYREWKARKTVLMNALVRSGADASDEPVVLELTVSTFSQVLAIIEEYGNVASLDEGMDIVIERSGKGLDTEYRVLPAAKSDPLPKGVVEKIIDLDAFIEKEYFRGDEAKAIRAIGSVTGLALGPSSAKPALLSTKAGSDLDLEVLSPPKAAKIESKPAAKSVAEEFGSDIDDLESLLDDLETAVE